MSRRGTYADEHEARRRAKGLVLYGPLRSGRGRLINWVRSLLGLHQLMEATTYLVDDREAAASSITATWTANGIYTITDEGEQ